MDDPSMAAAVAEPRPPPPRAAGSRRGFFGFLKDGVLVTTRNRSLFLPLAALHAARSLALLAARILAIRYLGPTLGLKADGDDGFFSALLDKFLDGRWWLLPVGVAYLVADVANMVLGQAIQVAMVCAAVASCSAASIEGGPGRTTLTLASLLGEVRRNLSRYMETDVFVQVVGLASAFAGMLVLVAVLTAAAAYLHVGPLPGELVYFLLHLIATPVILIYYSIAREVAVVVSVAEPGLRAGGAFRRARQLTRGAKKVAQATLHALLSRALNKAVWKMYAVTMARVPAAPFWLDAVVVYMLVGAVDVLYMATVTAYYFDCKRTEEEKAGHIHIE